MLKCPRQRSRSIKPWPTTPKGQQAEAFTQDANRRIHAMMKRLEVGEIPDIAAEGEGGPAALEYADKMEQADDPTLRAYYGAFAEGSNPDADD